MRYAVSAACGADVAILYLLDDLVDRHPPLLDGVLSDFDLDFAFAHRSLRSLLQMIQIRQ
jgi:hypothetical protein